jgi:hypothetical protein
MKVKRDNLHNNIIDKDKDARLVNPQDNYF